VSYPSWSEAGTQLTDNVSFFTFKKRRPENGLMKLDSLKVFFASMFASMKTVPGGIVAVISELIVGIVMMFVGIFMIAMVALAIALNNTSVFWSTYQGLISTTGTVFSVLGLLIIVVALATAIGSLKSVSQ
jgi:hypothetical protein